MASFDISSEVDFQEVRNAVDQADREVTTRFDFKNTGSTIELKEKLIELHAPTEDRPRALIQVMKEKFVRRNVSLKSLDYKKAEEATKGTLRQEVALQAGISQDHAKKI